MKKPSLAENEASPSCASPNPDRSASLSHPFATVPPKPNYVTSYPPPPIDHFPSHDPSQSQLVSRTSSPGLVTHPSRPPHHLPQHQNQQQRSPHPLRHPHPLPYSGFPSSSSGSIPIPPPSPGRSSLSHTMNSCPTSSHLRRPTQQHSPSLGGQASLHSPSLGKSFGRSSRLYHPYGNPTSSMGDAYPDGVSRRSGSSDGRGGNSGHRQYGTANSFFPLLSPPGTGRETSLDSCSRRTPLPSAIPLLIRPTSPRCPTPCNRASTRTLLGRRPIMFSFRLSGATVEAAQEGNRCMGSEGDRL
jgi:hypothetical protein